MSSKYTKDYQEQKPCCGKGRYYTHNNLFKYASQNHAADAQSSVDPRSTNPTDESLGEYVKEKYCGKNCQPPTPNSTTYYKVPKVDCWIGVM